MTYRCGVNNCGGGVCVHQLTDELCPLCKRLLVRVTTTNFMFCSAESEYECDYERSPGTDGVTQLGSE